LLKNTEKLRVMKMNAFTAELVKTPVQMISIIVKRKEIEINDPKKPGNYPWIKGWIKFSNFFFLFKILFL